MYFSVAVLVLVGAALTSCDEDRCSKFEYDRELLEKIVRVESENEFCQERLSEVEEELRSLKEDFISLAADVKTDVAKTVAKAAERFVQIPDIESEETDGWSLLFRATAGTGQNVYKAWTGIDVTTTKPKDMKKSLSKHYLNMNLMNEWTTRPISKVKFSVFDNQLEVAYIIFNGRGTTRDTWFNESRVLASSWPTLLIPAYYNYFSTVGHPEVKRRFFINLNYGGCQKDKGYMTVVDTGIATQNICTWDRQATFPQFLYSKTNGPVVWSHLEYGQADYIAVFIQ